MTLQEIIADIHALNEDLEVYERKYGVLSETFYELYQSGEEPENEAWVLDWADWAGAYKILLRRHYDHPVYTPESLRAQREMANINGRDRIYFAGAYLGWGFHEDGVRSARRAIDAIERLRVPDAA